jgi:hypothetical protein
VKVWKNRQTGERLFVVVPAELRVGHRIVDPKASTKGAVALRPAITAFDWDHADGPRAQLADGTVHGLPPRTARNRFLIIADPEVS